MPGIFEGMKSAKRRIDGNYVIPSHFIGRIVRVKQGRTRKEEGFFAVEMQVVHDFEPERAERGIYGHSIGEEVTHLMMAKHDSFLGNVKGFIGAVLDLPDDAIGENEAVKVTSDDQPLSGLLVEVAARNTRTRAGRDFTVVNYKGEVPKEDLFAIWKQMGDNGKALYARFFGKQAMSDLEQRKTAPAPAAREEEDDEIPI